MLNRQCTEHEHPSAGEFHRLALRLLEDGQLMKFTCSECRHRYLVAVMLESGHLASDGGDDDAERTINAVLDLVNELGSKPFFDFKRKRLSPSEPPQ